MKPAPKTVNLRIILERPTAGVDFGLQEGHGNSYTIAQKQRSTGGDLEFEFTVNVKPGKDQLPNFTGPFVQGPTGEKFVYINIGTCAGQTETCWSRRLKIPLNGTDALATANAVGITWDMLNSGKVLVALIPGTAPDGSPSCAYSWLKTFPSWSWKTSR